MNDTIIIVNNNGMGKADEKLQHTLFAKYVELIQLNSELPAAFCFYADGVKLVCEGSPVIDKLKELEAKNVRLIVCSTCLNYLNLQDKIQVGIVGGMGDILEAQVRAGKVITL